MYSSSLCFHKFIYLYSTVSYSYIPYYQGIKIFPLTDLSGYFVFIDDILIYNCAKICKYLFSSASIECQEITSINNNFEFLKISDSHLFFLGAASASTKNLQMYKINFLSISVDWAKQIICTETWPVFDSESVLSSDSSKIYSFFIFGAPSTTYLYFAGLSVSDGSVITTRYKSSADVNYLSGSALNGDYIIATTYYPSLVMYSISSSTFIIKSFSGYGLFGWGVEPSSGR